MPNIMPDIAHHAIPQTEGTLSWVGMDNIEMPLRIEADGEAVLLIGLVPDHRGGGKRQCIALRQAIVGHIRVGHIFRCIGAESRVWHIEQSYTCIGSQL